MDAITVPEETRAIADELEENSKDLDAVGLTG